MPAEVEIREEWSETQKLGIAIALLSDRNEEFLLDWVKDVSFVQCFAKRAHFLRQRLYV